MGWLFQDNVWIVRLAFIPALVYILWNWDTVRAIERIGPTPKEIIETNTLARTWTMVIVLAEIGFVFAFLYTGRNFGDYLNGYWPLFAALIAPIALPLLLSQLALYRKLERVES